MTLVEMLLQAVQFADKEEVMSTEKVLFESKWLSVIEKTLDNGGRYLFTRADWCNSKGVAILPYRFNEDKGVEFLGRYEHHPSYSDNLELGAIMGGMDKEGEEPVVTAWRELIEEGGCKVPIENIFSLGKSRPSKSTDNLMYLFAVCLDDGFEKVEATGDGSLVEEGGYSKWIDLGELIESDEPLLQSMYVRLAFRKTDEFIKRLSS